MGRGRLGLREAASRAEPHEVDPDGCRDGVFTAPEVYRDGSTATAAADIYSLGRVLGWLIVDQPIEPNKAIPVDPASPWAAFVNQTTKDDPAERPASIAAALDLLKPAFAFYAGEAPALPSKVQAVLDVDRALVDAFLLLLQDPVRGIQL